MRPVRNDQSKKAAAKIDLALPVEFLNQNFVAERSKSFCNTIEVKADLSLNVC